MTKQSHNSVMGTVISPRLNLGVRSDIWQVSGSTEFVRNNYSDMNSLNRDDQHYRLFTSYSTERSMWQLNGSQDRTSVLTDREISTNTGLVQVQREQNAHSINPVWTWLMTELTQLQLSYRLTDVGYVNGQRIALYDYRTQNVTAQLSRQFTPQNLGFLSAGYSFFRVPVTTVESRTRSVQAGVSRQFSETLKGTISGGLQKTETIIPVNVPIVDASSSNPAYLNCLYVYYIFGYTFEYAQEQCYPYAIIGFTKETQRLENTNSVYSVNLENQFETMRANLVLTRAVEPSGSGSQVKTDSLSLTLERGLAEKMTGYFSLNIYEVSLITGTVSGVDRRLYQIQPRLRWQWTQEWNVDVAYRYTRLKRVSEDRAVNSNQAFLTLLYQWPKWSISR